MGVQVAARACVVLESLLCCRVLRLLSVAVDDLWLDMVPSVACGLLVCVCVCCYMFAFVLLLELT